MSEERLEVYRQLRYVYFLLAAAGAAIGLAVNQTQGAGLTKLQIPLAAAVLCWGLSFFFGCLHLAYVSSTLYSNAELLRVREGQHPEVGTNSQTIRAASAGILSAMENNSKRANRFGHLQFFILILGAVLYLGWHVLEMWART